MFFGGGKCVFLFFRFTSSPSHSPTNFFNRLNMKKHNTNTHHPRHHVNRRPFFIILWGVRKIRCVVARVRLAAERENNGLMMNNNIFPNPTTTLFAAPTDAGSAVALRPPRCQTRRTPGTTCGRRALTRHNGKPYG